MYVNNSVLIFHFFGVWLWVTYWDFHIIKIFPIIKLFMFLFYFIKANWKCNLKVQHVHAL